MTAFALFVVTPAAIVVFIVLLALSLRNAPTCTCGDPECGGGCLTRRS